MKIRAAAVNALAKKTAEELVRVSKSPKHPLHKEFLWSNQAKAASLWRLDKAREIIASVRVVVSTSTQRITSVAYVRDPRSPPNKQGFVSVVKLRGDRDYAQEALDLEVIRVKADLERAREFAAAVDLIEEFEAALASITRLHSSGRSRKGPPAQRLEVIAAE